MDSLMTDNGTRILSHSSRKGEKVDMMEVKETEFRV